MTEPSAITDVANAIQLSVAPVFLLAGIGGILNVLTSRLSRAVDRVRLLSTSPDLCELNASRQELSIQLRRTRLIHWSIILCTICALAICMVVALLFEGTDFLTDPSMLIKVLFIGGMVALTAGLILFLREIGLALRIMRSFSTASKKSKGR